MDEQREWQYDDYCGLHDGTGGDDPTTAALYWNLDGTDKYSRYAVRDYLNALEQRVREAEAERCCLCGGVEDEHLPGGPTAPYKLDATEDHEFYRPADIQDVSQFLQLAEARVQQLEAALRSAHDATQ